MTALRDPEVLPDHELATLLRDARWRRLAVLGDSVAEGVREPHDDYLDLSWVDRIEASLRTAAPQLAVLNLGRRNLLAAEVRARQLEPALSFGLAMAGGIMLAGLSLSFTDMTEASSVIPPDQKEQISRTLEEDAQVMSNTQVEALLVGEPEAVQAEILRINTHARDVSLQVALLVSVLASLIGLLNSIRMRRLPDIGPSSVEGATLG